MSGFQEPISEPNNYPFSYPVSEPINYPVSDPVSEPINYPVSDPDAGYMREVISLNTYFPVDTGDFFQTIQEAEEYLSVNHNIILKEERNGYHPIERTITLPVNYYYVIIVYRHDLKHLIIFKIHDDNKLHKIITIAQKSSKSLGTIINTNHIEIHDDTKFIMYKSGTPETPETHEYKTNIIFKLNTGIYDTLHHIIYYGNSMISSKTGEHIKKETINGYYDINDEFHSIYYYLYK